MLPLSVTCTCHWWLHDTTIISSSLKWRPTRARFPGNHVSGQWFSQQVKWVTSVVWASGLNPGDTTFVLIFSWIPCLDFPICKMGMMRIYPLYRSCVNEPKFTGIAWVLCNHRTRIACIPRNNTQWLYDLWVWAHWLGIILCFSQQLLTRMICLDSPRLWDYKEQGRMDWPSLNSLKPGKGLSYKVQLVSDKTTEREKQRDSGRKTPSREPQRRVTLKE